MNRRVQEVLENRGENYLLPLFWQHGEDEGELREEMARIQESGIGAVCMESRPHTDFCGPRWWRDMDIVMDEARRRGMKVWVMDDVHFPTGFANGWIRDRFPERKKVFLGERHIDVVGPKAGARVLLREKPVNPPPGPEPFLVDGWKASRTMPTCDISMAPYVGPDQDAGWEALPAADGFLDVQARRDPNGIVYLTRCIQIEEDCERMLHVGHDGGARIFLDGRPLAATPGTVNPARPTRTQVCVKLRRGDHELCVALDRSGGNGCGIFVSLQRPCAVGGETRGCGGAQNESEEQILVAVGVLLTPTGEAGGGEPVNLTGQVADGQLHWDIPAGHWRVSIVAQTPQGGNLDFLNPIDRASSRVLIDAVYEPHYVRYAADFGKTFAGFFSDEPNIGNNFAGWYDCAIGRKAMSLPWRAGLLEELSREFGGEVASHLPGLWHDIGASTWPVRYAYMNLVSRLYSECFAGQIGAWCAERGVGYIGHIVEDNDSHTRLGTSVPHFFRAMDGQTMSGIDVVLWQIRPGLDRRRFKWPAGHADGEFYHYELAKLGASHAHIDRKKRGRAMCEIYGAYGWAEGLRLMKWLTDHMLVRGINVFSPHAFSPMEFPDPDCPPHFYARGRNPQYRHFRLLMEYANRMCHLLSDGRHLADAAIVYHAEAEWSGNCMSAKEPMRVLMQAQLDADIVPADILSSDASVEDGKLRIADEMYGCLILPWAERLPRGMIRRLVELLESGVRLACVKGWPEATTEDGARGGDLDILRRHANARVTELDGLSELMRGWGVAGDRTGTCEPYLRRYAYCHEGLKVWMFFNEDPYQTIRTAVYLEEADRVVAYEAFDNRLRAVAGRRQGAGVWVDLALSAEESLVLLAGDVPEPPVIAHWSEAQRDVSLEAAAWQVSTATAEQYPEFTPWQTQNSLTSLTAPGLLPEFSGTIRYETNFAAPCPAEGRVFLDLGEVGEVAEAWLNGTALGVRICRPYVFDVTEALRAGTNALYVEVVNTLVCEMKDKLSKHAALDPTGLLGPVRLCYGTRKSQTVMKTHTVI